MNSSEPEEQQTESEGRIAELSEWTDRTYATSYVRANHSESGTVSERSQHVHASVRSAQAELAATNAERTILAAKIAMLSAQVALHSENDAARQDRESALRRRLDYLERIHLRSGAQLSGDEASTPALLVDSEHSLTAVALAGPAIQQRNGPNEAAAKNLPSLPPEKMNVSDDGAHVTAWRAHASAISVSNPTVSIIVSSGQPSSVDGCLDLIARFKGHVPIEVAIVSGVGNSQRNAAAAEASGRYILFLDSNIEPMAGWLDNLTEVFNARCDAAIVGPKILFSDRRLKSAGGFLWRDGTPIAAGRFDDPDLPQFNHIVETDYLPGAALLVDAGFFKSVGGFDDDYSQLSCADADLSLKARELRLKAYYQPESVVIQHDAIAGVRSVGTVTGDIESQRRFYDRWRESLNRNISKPDVSRQFERRFQSAQMTNFAHVYQRIDSIAITLLNKLKELSLDAESTAQNGEADSYLKNVETELENIRKGAILRITEGGLVAS